MAQHFVVASATAVDRPCQLYKYHSPKPSRTQGHHRHPVYLQNVVYGKIQDPELLWVCGTCHDNIHEWLSWLLGEARRPTPEPGVNAKREAQASYDWFIDAGGTIEELLTLPKAVTYVVLVSDQM